MADTIKFGTDGWRAIIADTYTVQNVARVADATAKWIKSLDGQEDSVVIGHDCRFGGELFMKQAAVQCAAQGLKVYYHSGVASTPMVSLGAMEFNAAAGIIITASHNPPSYNGFKIKGNYGGPALPAMISEVESLITDEAEQSDLSFEDFEANGQIEQVDLEGLYIEKVEENFDLDAIRNSGMRFAYDAMYGAGQKVMKRLFPDALLMHCDENPGFMGTAPEPIMKNLTEFSQAIKEAGNISSGLATDGDADRIGLLDAEGEFVDSHHIILMLILYLHKYKGLEGSVVASFSCTGKIGRMARHFGLEHKVTKIGFKYIAEHILNENVLVGGEESGGIAVKTHIPERDGLWMGLTIWEYMAKTGKSMADLKQEVYDLVGPFAFERFDLHIQEEQKQRIVANCEADEYKSFGQYEVKEVQKTDGFKFILDDDRWLMIRPSGTEPVLRTYAEAPTYDEAVSILENCKSTILG